MISILLAIVTGVLLIAGIAYGVFRVFPFLADFWNTTTANLQGLSSFLPSWLVPFVGVALALAFIGLLVKLL